MQRGPMPSPALFCRYIRMLYERLMTPAREANGLVHMHSDGDNCDLVEDMLASGVNALNLQDLVNGVEWIAARLKGPVCIDLDIDRQQITPFAPPGRIDALRWFARNEAEEVSAYQVRTENPIEYPGTISVNVRFADGKIGRTTTTFDTQMPYRFNIGVHGTEGAVRNDEVFAPKLFPGQTNFMKIPCVLPDSGDVVHHPFRGEVSHFLDCVLGDQRPFPDLDDAAMTLAVCFAADLSAESGKPVKISELGII